MPGLAHSPQSEWWFGAGWEFTGSRGSKSGRLPALLELATRPRSGSVCGRRPPHFSGSCAVGSWVPMPLPSHRFGESSSREVQRVPCSRDRPPFWSRTFHCPLLSDAHIFFVVVHDLACYEAKVAAREKKKRTLTTLNGGSLGSCVDEERSQLRELM